MPTEEIFTETITNESLYKAFSKSIKGLLKNKKYSEAYTAVLNMATAERGIPLDSKTIQDGLDALAAAKTQNDQAVIDLFQYDFVAGLDNSDAPKTAQALSDAFKSSISPAAIGIGLLAVGVITLAMRKN